MKVKMRDGKVVDHNTSYAYRLIEHGKASLVNEKESKKETKKSEGE